MALVCLPFLSRPAVESTGFTDLKKEATKRAREVIAKKKHGADFAKLSAVEQAEVTAAAQAAVDSEAGLLPKTVPDVLKADVEPFERAVNNLVTVALRQAAFDTLVSFAFNVGVGNFKKSTLLKKINHGKFRSGDAKTRAAAITAIEAEFMKWNKSGGRVLSGLTKRRKSEAARFLSEARQELEALEKKPH